MGINKRIAFHALTWGMGLAATALGKSASMRGWQLVKKQDPPVNPAARKTTWTTALTWAAVSGAAAAMMGVVGRRGAAGLWKKRVGRLPAGVR